MTGTATMPTPVLDQGRYLTPHEEQSLRLVLAQRLEDQRNRARWASATLDEFSSSDSPYDREIARETLTTVLDAIQHHEDALSRLASGRYGVCLGCAGPIPFPRLEAIPEVQYCVSCSRPG